MNTGYGASSKSGRGICLRVANLRRGKTRQVWLSTVSGRSQRTPLDVRSWPKRALMQVAYYDASVSVSADVGLQRDGYYYPAYS